MIYFLIVVIVIYLIYTLNFAIKFNKTNTVFNNNQILLHNLLIWIIPFFWIMIVKSMIAPTPGSHKFKKSKEDSGFHESGFGIFGHEDRNNFHEDLGGGHDVDH